MNNKKINIREIIEWIRSVTKDGILSRRNGNALYNSLKKYYKETTLYGDWENAVYDEEDFENRMRIFIEKAEESHINKKTIYAYKSRAKSAILMYKKDNEFKKENPMSSSDNEPKSVINNLEFGISVLQDFVPEEKRNNIYTDDVMNNANVFIFPISINNIASIMFPKNVSKEELDVFKKTTDSIIAIEKYKIRLGGNM